MSQNYSTLGFFSYTHGAGADQWYSNSKDRIEQYFQNFFGAKDRRIFFDRHSIQSGMDWKIELRDGLDRAPLLIAFFSPAYFNSPYCVAELKTFMAREDQLDLKRGTLIHAAKVYDQCFFPAWARRIKAVALDEFFLLDESFWESPRTHDYDVAIKKFADSATKKIRHIATNGPRYSPDFPKIADVPDQPELDPDLLALFGPQATVPQPFARREGA
jgi:hypothetical protein